MFNSKTRCSLVSYIMRITIDFVVNMTIMLNFTFVLRVGITPNKI